MSSANLQSKNLDFNISVIAQGVQGSVDVTPLDTGVLSYLEIEDSLINPGIKGTIAIKNSYSIMDRLDTFRATEKKLFLDINIEDIDSKSKNAFDKKISLSTMLENSSTITTNITDNIIVFNFEEAQISMLKKLSMRRLWDVSSKPDKSPSNTIEGHVQDILNTWVQTLPADTLSEKGKLIDSDFFINKESGKRVNLQSYWWDIEDSVFDVLTRLVENIQIESALPLFKIQNLNDGDNISREFTLKKMFTEEHHNFLRSRADNSPGSFSDVYLEEFVLAPEEDRTGGEHASGLYGTVEDYEIVKADIETARGSYWCDYILNNGSTDLTSTEINIIDFTDIVSSFEDNDLGDIDGFNCAIPALQPVDKKILKVDRVDESIKEEDKESLLGDYVNNKVKRSFLFLNDVIVFTVRGQMFRKPGTFITINGGDVIGRGAPYDIWFVVSVKHTFKELNYENEVVAVRLFGNSKRYIKLVNPDSQQPA